MLFSGTVLAAGPGGPGSFQQPGDIKVRQQSGNKKAPGRPGSPAPKPSPPHGPSHHGPSYGHRISILPRGFETLMIAGLTYYLVAGTYYQRSANGYIVVDPPPANIQQSSGIVVVNTGLLNVRSGPGTENGVVAQVSRGQQLQVKGVAPDWYYVQLSNGTDGWVMMKYVNLLGTAANG